MQAFFGGDKSILDRRVDESLAMKGVKGQDNPAKTHGVNRRARHPIGTVASVSIGTRKAILVVGATFDDATTKTTTSALALWSSLLTLWDAAATDGERRPLAMPIWGANLGNAPGNRLVLLQTILCSFAAAAASTNQPCTPELRILVWEGDYRPSEFSSMVDTLKSVEL